MNKKLTLKKKNGAYIYCVLSSQNSLEKQLNTVFRIDTSACFHPVVEIDKEKIYIKDNRTCEIIAEYKIVALEDTDDCVSLVWAEE